MPYPNRDMSKNLVIVESPAKAKTIQGYLGKDYTVASSFGHIRDLPKKKMAVDIDGDFLPEYEITGDKKKRVSELRKLMNKDTVVWLATDEDREGEAIAWHLREALKLSDQKTKRIVFHEITKQAIEAAVNNPRNVDQKLVDAQQARRVLDRLVGYELSPVLWRKVRPGLSAGRVQSVAVRLIVEREREIEAFKSSKSFKLTAELAQKSTSFTAQYPKDIKDESEAESLLQSLLNRKLQVLNLKQTDATRNPSPPFTTSTLQQEAARRLGFSVKQTMTLAQKLYESGAITYMRTDSLALSDQARSQAATYIKSEFGQEYHQPRTFKTKSKGAQEAHEAIRPTEASRGKSGNDERTAKLYDLIRGRFLASQMSPAKLKRTTVEIGSESITLEAKGEVITFGGWIKAYPQSSIKDNELPPLKIGDEIILISAEAVETLSRQPARYSEAALVRRLEEMGIGRPSTYAPTISTIQSRGYVEKGIAPTKQYQIKKLLLSNGKISKSTDEKQVGGEKGKLLPTDTALVVTDFLVKHFPDVVDYDFTASVEEEFDAIANGERQWNSMIKEFYQDFHKTVEEAKQVSRKEASQARELGVDPTSKRPVAARYGRYGPMVQIGNSEDEEKPRFAPLPPGTTIDTVTLEQALTMFELPRSLGVDDQGTEIKANIGRYGPYVQRDRVFASVPTEEDIFSISLKRAVELIEEKENQKQRQLVAEFEDGKIQVKNGRYGPYVTNGKVNVKIPKTMNAEKISEKEARELLDKKAKAS